MSETNKKCIITRYNEKIKKPPFLTIQIDTICVPKPEIDNLGEEFAIRLITGCRMKGYKFKFYTTSRTKGYDYEIVVE